MSYTNKNKAHFILFFSYMSCEESYNHSRHTSSWMLIFSLRNPIRVNYNQSRHTSSWVLLCRLIVVVLKLKQPGFVRAFDCPVPKLHLMPSASLLIHGQMSFQELENFNDVFVFFKSLAPSASDGIEVDSGSESLDTRHSCSHGKSLEVERSSVRSSSPVPCLFDSFFLFEREVKQSWSQTLHVVRFIKTRSSSTCVFVGWLVGTATNH